MISRGRIDRFTSGGHSTNPPHPSNIPVIVSTIPPSVPSAVPSPGQGFGLTGYQGLGGLGFIEAMQAMSSKKAALHRAFAAIGLPDSPSVPTGSC